jgi:hypothetical protein
MSMQGRDPESDPESDSESDSESDCSHVWKHLPAEVTGLLQLLLAGIREIVGPNLVGLYLRGSLALGDFLPETSDVDLLAVTDAPVDSATFEALEALHERLAVSAPPYGRRSEIAYIDRAALLRFQPGLRHPTLGQGETLAWTEHFSNWILERWMVRKSGVILLGPDPQSLIAPVSRGEIRAAVRARLADWAEWANQPDNPDWRLSRAHKAYVVETMCRALACLACDRLLSKPAAVAWARENLPEPWRSTVERAEGWRTDQSLDPELVPEVRAFVLWTAFEAARQYSADRPDGLQDAESGRRVP